MQADFFSVMNKLSKKDNDMENFINKYILGEQESLKLFNGSFQYCRTVNADDEQLEELLIDVARENNWLNKNNMIDIKKIPEITKKYLEEKDQFLEMAPKIIEKAKEIYEQIDEMNLGLFGQVSDEDKKTIKDLLLLKAQIADNGIDCLLYLSIIRFCFNPNVTSVGYRLVREKTKLDQNMDVLLRMDVGMEIGVLLLGLLEEVCNS